MFGCDPEHRKKCEWYIVPDQDRAQKVEGELVPVCARNYVVNKQDCRLMAKLDYAKDTYNRPFKYVDMKIDSPGNPRTIVNIKFCK